MTSLSHTSLRIIDANVNRAREALRVIEEYARFGLDDAGLSGAIKDTRHALAKYVDDFVVSRGLGPARALEHDDSARGKASGSPNSARAEARGSGDSARAQARGSLIAHRQIVGDVGRDVGTEAEYRRADALAVALTAGKRLSEALRAIEEYGKVVDPNFAAAIEQVRYRGYELERRLALTANARERFQAVHLYVLLTESLCSDDWFKTAEAALRGGADCLQLREKDLSDRELLTRAERLAKLCRDRGGLFIVNDRPDVAAAVNADGVHLGQDDLPVAAARRILPPGAVVGVSAHTIGQVTAAAAETPDYIAVGPMFATATKPQDHIAGPATLAAARAHTSLPLVAIGGITAENAGEILSAAACCLCICSGVIAQADVEAATARLRALIDESVGG